MPIAIGYGSCFLLGMAIGANGGSVAGVFVAGLLTELGIIITLAGMAAKERKVLPASAQQDTDAARIAATDLQRTAV